MKKTSALTLGQLARQVGVNPQTIYYYEKNGILPPPARSDSGYRQYDTSALQRMRFIKNAQSLGFSLKEIKELLELRIKRESQCDDVLNRTEQKLTLVQQKIAELTRLEEALRQLVSACEARESTDTCPILGALEKN